MKQKVLIVHNYYQIPGGEDRVVSNEKQLLQANGHNVILYSRHNNEIKDIPLLLKLMLPFCMIFNPRTYRDVRKLIQNEKIDIVHVHNTLNLISPSVYYAAFRCKVPVVQTIHNFRFLCPGATFYCNGHICEDCLDNGLKCAIQNACYRNSKTQTFVCVISLWIHRLLGTYKKLNYICLTKFNKKKLLKLPQIQGKKVFVKPNFVEQLQEINPYSKREGVIYAGRLDEQKGIKILFDAWKLMGENAPKLTVCGTGPEEKWCRRYKEKYSLENIDIIGFVPNEAVRQYIAKSKALILPTQWYEGFPMSMVEAFSVGTPVIGSKIGNVGDLIEDGVNGWRFDHNSSKSLAIMVKNISDIVESTYQCYLNKYTAEINYKLLSNIYKEACR